MNENTCTQFSQECGIMIGENRNTGIITSHPHLENTSDENAIINANSDEQPNNIPRDQLQDFLTTVMQAIRAESAKLTPAVQSLKSEIKKDNEQLVKSLTEKFEAAHDKIRKDFKIGSNSEILIVSERINDVRKDNETS
jgi:hypothetical protein